MLNSTRNIEIILDKSIKINSNLHLNINITKSTLSLPNSAKIEIFNISPTTLKVLLTEPQIVINIDKKQAFIGKVINAENNYKGANWCCTIYCNDIKTNPTIKPEYLEIPKGTNNEDVLKIMASSISDLEMDMSNLKDCAKAKGSLLKSMVVDYKKEGDIIKVMQNMFKDCDSQIVKEDGKVTIQNKKNVPNSSKPLIFDVLLEAPNLSHKDISLQIPFESKVKLGLGFEVKSKSTKAQLESPFTYKNQFLSKVYRISEITHTADNYSDKVAITSIKGLNLGT